MRKIIDSFSKYKKILITGGAGFIGSVLIWKLNQLGWKDIIVVDELGQGAKWKNLAKREF